MSTSATIAFKDRYLENPITVLYVHGDGYPDDLGERLKRILATIGQLKDTRFDDPNYLIARIIYMLMSDDKYVEREKNTGNFLGYGFLSPTDIIDVEYQYTVEMWRDKPVLICRDTMEAQDWEIVW